MIVEKKTLVLMLDDDADFNNWMKVFFSKLEIQFQAYTTAFEFASALKNQTPTLCLIDLNLDRDAGEGFQMIKAIRSKLQTSLPILVISRRTASEDIVQALEAGANDFIPKPVDKITLEAKLKRYLTPEIVSTLPYFSVTESMQASVMNLSMSLSKVTESEMEFIGPHLILKHTYLRFSSPLIQEITGKNPFSGRVHRNGVTAAGNAYMISVEFDPSDLEIIANVRSWLSKNKT